MAGYHVSSQFVLHLHWVNSHVYEYGFRGEFLHHYGHVTSASRRSKSVKTRLYIQQLVWANKKITVPHYWPLPSSISLMPWSYDSQGSKMAKVGGFHWVWPNCCNWPRGVIRPRWIFFQTPSCTFCVKVPSIPVTRTAIGHSKYLPRADKPLISDDHCWLNITGGCTCCLNEWNFPRGLLYGTGWQS